MSAGSDLSRNNPASQGRPGAVVVLSIAAAVACALALVAPLDLHPGRLCFYTDPDTQELMWRLLWGVHSLAHHPLEWMNANAFYPDEGSYATMDYVFGLSVLAVPFRALSSNPLLVYNLTCLLSLAIGACGAYALALLAIGEPPAAAVAALVFAVDPVHLGRLGQINILADHWLPWLLLALLELFERPAAIPAALLAAALFLAATTGGYQAIFAGMVLCIGLAVLAAAAARRGKTARPLAWTIAAALLSGLLFAPLAWPYVEGAEHHSRVRTLGEVQSHSSLWRDLAYLDSDLHNAVRRALRSDDPLRASARSELMPGFGALVLAMGGVAALRKRRRWPELWLYGALAVSGFAMSLGTNFPGYAWLYRIAPPLRMIRAPSRFSLVGLLGLAVLCAFGMSALADRVRATRPRAAWALAPIVGVLLVVEWWKPIGTEVYRYDPPPAVYGWLAGQPGDPAVVELPSAADLNPFYLLYSTAHWKPLVNGYSGSFITPYHAHLLAELLPSVPDPASLEALSEILGLRYVVVHTHPDPAQLKTTGHFHAFAALTAMVTSPPPELRPVWKGDDGDAVLELVDPPEGHAGPVLRRLAPGERLRGAELSFEGRAVDFAGDSGGRAIAVSLDGSEIARLPVGREFSRMRVPLPATSVHDGINTIDLADVHHVDTDFLASRGDLEIGHTGTRLAGWVVVESSTVAGRSRASVLVDGREVSGDAEGLNAVALDAASAAVLTRDHFATGQSDAEWSRLAAWLDRLPAGTPVAIAARAGAGTAPALSPAKVELLRSLGSALEAGAPAPASYALIGVKGAAPGTALERRDASGVARLAHGGEELAARIAIRSVELVRP